MGRNLKRKSSESSEEVDGSYGDVVPVTQFKSGFFVPCHPLLTLGKQNLINFCQLLLLPDIYVAIVYGMYLTIASALCPHTCLPRYLPVASLAASLGRLRNILKDSYITHWIYDYFTFTLDP